MASAPVKQPYRVQGAGQVACQLSGLGIYHSALPVNNHQGREALPDVQVTENSPSVSFYRPDLKEKCGLTNHD